MSIRDYFKVNRHDGEAGPGGLRDAEQILAWLEELWRMRAGVQMAVLETGAPGIQGKVERVDEDDGSLTVHFQWKPTKEPVAGRRYQVSFIMDGQRYQADLEYQGRGGYLDYRFGLPEVILRAERRDTARVKLQPGENLHLVALQGLGEGLGLGGILVDLSMGGCCFLLRRAVQIRDGGRVQITPSLLTAGTPLAVVRLPNLPDLLPVECGGEICYLREVADGIIAGLRFEGLGMAEAAILARFLNGRIPDFSYGFPRKRRYRDLVEGELEAPQTRVPGEAGGDLGNPGEAADGAEDEDEASAAAQAEAGTPAAAPADPLVRIRKRGKKILLVMEDELERMLLLVKLQHAGYRCLFEAGSVVQALNHHRKVPLDCLVLDQTVGPMPALRMVELLREQGLPRDVPVVVLRRVWDVQLTLAEKAGKVSLVVDHPMDFNEALKESMEAMLGLSLATSVPADGAG